MRQGKYLQNNNYDEYDDDEYSQNHTVSKLNETTDTECKLKFTNWSKIMERKVGGVAFSISNIGHTHMQTS